MEKEFENTETHVPFFLKAEELLFSKFMRGEFHNGEAIKESKLAVELGVSRRAMREALYQAVGWGIMEYEAFKGFSIVDMTLGNLYDLSELRDAIETVSVRRITQEHDEEKIKYFEKLLAASKAALDSGNNTLFAALDVVFHLQIVRLSGNHKFNSPSLLCSMILMLVVCYGYSSTFNYERSKELKERQNSKDFTAASDMNTYREHTLVVEALRFGNAEVAAKLIHEHLHWQCFYLSNGIKQFGKDTRVSKMTSRGNEWLTERTNVFEHVVKILPDLINL